MSWSWNAIRRKEDYAREVNRGWNYTPDEIEFMLAMERYMRLNCIPFPTCKDVLKVAKQLGYEKQ